MCDALSALMNEVNRADVPSDDESKELAARAGGGDRNAANELVRRNMPLVVSLATRYSRDQDHDRLLELIQEGAIGMWRAAMGYDPSCGVKFVTYAYRAVDRQIRKKLAIRMKDQVIVCASPLKDSSGASSDYNRETAREIARAVECLSEADQYIICRRYGLDGDKRRSTLKEVGEVLGGVTGECIRQRQLDALEVLRERLDGVM